MNRSLLLVTIGACIFGFLAIWFLSPFVLQMVSRITFLLFRPFSSIIQAEITKEFIVLTKREQSTVEAAPAWEIRYVLDGKIFEYVDASRIMFGERDISPEVPSAGMIRKIQEKSPSSNLDKFLKTKTESILTKDFEKYRVLRPHVYFIPNLIPMKTSSHSTLGEIYGAPLVCELSQYSSKENGFPPIKIRIFKWFPSWPDSPFSNYWSAINTILAGLIGIGIILLFWVVTIKSIIGIHDTNSYLFFGKVALLFILTFIAIKWPCPMKRQWLDPTKRPRILIDSNFSENTRLWERN